MIILASFLVIVSAVNSFPFDSRDCFEHSEMSCMEIFVDAVFYSKEGINECSELRKFIDCSADAVDECYGDERDGKINRGLEELENLRQDACGSVASGDDSDFDEETYSHLQLTATIKKKKKKKSSHSMTDKETSVSSDSKKCFFDKKKFCWEIFKEAVFRGVFNGLVTGLDKCNVLGDLIACTDLAYFNCYGFEINKDIINNIDDALEVWKDKQGEFCSIEVSDDKTDSSWIQNVPITSTTEHSHLPRPKNSWRFRITGLLTPQFQRTSNEEVGAWFKDAMPTSETYDRYYSILASDTNHLYEYNSMDAFRNSRTATEIHELPFPFTGTGHLVYNGSFYYHEANSQMLVRFEFNSKRSLSVRIPDASYNDEHYLYTSELSYMDVMADENGLWVVYSAEDTNNTMVRKLHSYTLSTEYMWNLTLPHRSMAEMFIASGFLYAVDSTTVPWPRIRFAFDLYQNKALDVNIPIENPFKNWTMIAYNPIYHEIFTWDEAIQFIYPVTYDYFRITHLEKEDFKEFLDSNWLNKK